MKLFIWGDIRLDNEIRGLIEQRIDITLKCDLLKEISWFKDELPLKSQLDLALGYCIGYVYRASRTVVQSSKDNEITQEETSEIKAIIKRRLPEFRAKIKRELDV